MKFDTRAFDLWLLNNEKITPYERELIMESLEQYLSENNPKIVKRKTRKKK